MAAALAQHSTFKPFLFFLLLLCTSILTSAADDDEDWEFSDEGWRSATATFTKDTNASLVTEGACGYGDLQKSGYGEYSAGVSSILFNRGSTCGACFEVRCVDHVLWCLTGGPTVVVTAADFCAPNYGLPSDYGGWCNFPREHFEMSRPAFAEIAKSKADIVPVQYRRVACERDGGMKFRLTGNAGLYQVLITNVNSDGQVVAVKIKGSRTGWIPMARNWGQYWESSVNLKGQPLSLEVTTSNEGRSLLIMWLRGIGSSARHLRVSKFTAEMPFAHQSSVSLVLAILLVLNYWYQCECVSSDF